VNLLDHGLLAQLIHEKTFLLDLDVIAQAERYGQLKEGEKVNKNFKSLFFYSQISDPEDRMAEDENIKTIFIHAALLMTLLFKKGR
jgi:hypothetical protein